MNLVMAIVKPFKLEEVRDALTVLGIHGMTITEVKGYARQKGHTEIYRGAEYAVNFLPKIRIEVAVAADATDRVVEAIGAAANTGSDRRRQDLRRADRARHAHTHRRDRRRRAVSERLFRPWFRCSLAWDLIFRGPATAVSATARRAHTNQGGGPPQPCLPMRSPRPAGRGLAAAVNAHGRASNRAAGDHLTTSLHVICAISSIARAISAGKRRRRPRRFVHRERDQARRLHSQRSSITLWRVGVCRRFHAGEDRPLRRSTGAGIGSAAAFAGAGRDRMQVAGGAHRQGAQPKVQALKRWRPSPLECSG
jgi:nitrogen regulatory protein P-II 2